MTEMRDRTTSRPVFGITSYAYRYHIGTPDFVPGEPMSAAGFLEAAHRLGCSSAQMCENLGFAALDREELLSIRDTAGRLGLSLEIGMRTLTEESLELHLALAGLLASRFLRIVLGTGSDYPEAEPDRLAGRAVSILRNAVPWCEKNGVSIGLENHFDLPTRRLVEVVDQVGSGRVGLVFDTTNALGFGERPEETLALMGSRVMSIHLKDYRFQKVEAGYRIGGTVLGEGLLQDADILRTAFGLNPAASVLLEMTIRRDPSMSAGETTRWEEAAIGKSALRLKETLDLLKREREDR